MSRHAPIRGTYPRTRPRAGEFIDEIAVELATSGERIVLNAVERRAAVEDLTRHGHSLREIARKLGLADRSVCRIRAAIRAARDTDRTVAA